MSLNHREIDLILSELELEGSWIQKIRQPDFHSLLLDVYKPEKSFPLYISLAPGKVRIHKLTLSIDNPKTLQRFAQFLRARIGSGKIIKAQQIGTDRIVQLTIQRDGEITLLWIRLWSGAANIIVTTEDGTILDAFYRRPKRGEITGGHYMPEAQEQRGLQGTYQIRDLPGEGSFNERIEAFYSGTESILTLSEVREKALAVVMRRETRLIATKERLMSRLSEYTDAEHYKQMGDLILSNAYRIEPQASWAELENYYDNGKSIRIQLDQRKSPEQNAEEFYERFRKAKAGLKILTEELAVQEERIKELETLKHRVEISDDMGFLKSLVAREAAAEKAVKHKETPGLSFSSGGYLILVGRSGK